MNSINFNAKELKKHRSTMLSCYKANIGSDSLRNCSQILIDKENKNLRITTLNSEYYYSFSIKSDVDIDAEYYLNSKKFSELISYFSNESNVEIKKDKDLWANLKFDSTDIKLPLLEDENLPSLFEDRLKTNENVLEFNISSKILYKILYKLRNFLSKEAIYPELYNIIVNLKHNEVCFYASDKTILAKSKITLENKNITYNTSNKESSFLIKKDWIESLLNFLKIDDNETITFIQEKNNIKFKSNAYNSFLGFKSDLDNVKKLKESIVKYDTLLLQNEFLLETNISIKNLDDFVKQLPTSIVDMYDDYITINKQESHLVLTYNSNMGEINYNIKYEDIQGDITKLPISLRLTHLNKITKSLIDIYKNIDFRFTDKFVLCISKNDNETDDMFQIASTIKLTT